MALKIPTLVKDFSGTGAVSKLDSNFTAVEDFFIAIVNSLPNINSTGGNLALTDRLAVTEGIVGHRSFVPSFNLEQDALTISHELPGDLSACVVGRKYHETTQAFTKDLLDVVTSEGSFELVFGVRSRGAPIIEMLVEIDDTNTTIELPIWKFNVTRVGNTCHVENLRLATKTLISRDLFDHFFHFEHAFTINYVGLLPEQNGPLPIGLICPWDCQVEGAFARLETGPGHTSGLTLEFWSGRGTDKFNVLAGSASWGAFESDEVIEINPKDEPQLLVRGSYIFPMITGGEGTTDPQAAHLSAVILLSRVYHEIR